MSADYYPYCYSFGFAQHSWIDLWYLLSPVDRYNLSYLFEEF